ncbi:hypothetical protein WHI96_25050 [Pseudonocardia tropica]|uniref:Uncharacterized protein n=1 Tax=Pseudonocardia tropica TaxID=681289 RepID=A0ABV1K2H5_9PSEU
MARHQRGDLGNRRVRLLGHNQLLEVGLQNILDPDPLSALATLRTGKRPKDLEPSSQLS